MKTDNILIDKWVKTPFENRGYLLLQNNIPLCHVKMAIGMKDNEDRYNADLIVTAVNNCKAINKNNPLAAAENLINMKQALFTLITKGVSATAQDYENAINVYKQATE